MLKVSKFFVCLLIVILFQSYTPSVFFANNNDVKEDIPIQYYFTENKGQWDKDILFMGNTKFGTIAFSSNAVHYTLFKENATQNQYPRSTSNTHQSSTCKITLSFEKSQDTFIYGHNPLSHFSNFFIDDNPSNWGIECSSYSRVVYCNVWPCIDLQYYFTPQGLKYDFLVHPGGDYKDIMIHVDGAHIHSQPNQLELKTPIGSLIDKDLTVYGRNSKSTYPASFLCENQFYGFHLSSLSNQNETIVIDPSVEWSEYIGGSMTDTGNDMVVDESGIYIIGDTNSENIISSEYSYAGNCDALIVRITKENKIAWTCYYGGSKEDIGSGIVVNKDYIYITGTTNSSNLPKKRTSGGSKGYNVFVAAFQKETGVLLQSYCYGGNDYDYASSISFGNMSELYIGGYTNSVDMPDSRNSYFGGESDSFVMKISTTGTLYWSLYVGGGDCDQTVSMEANSFAAYISGVTFSSDIQKSKNEYSGKGDGFTARVSSSGKLEWFRYLGGDHYDEINSISYYDDRLYVIGTTESRHLPSSINSHHGKKDVYVSTISKTGDIQVCLFLGGDKDDIAGCIFTYLDCLYIAGTTNSPNLNSAINSITGNNKHVFITKYVTEEFPDNHIEWTLYIGGSRENISRSLVVDEKGIYSLANTNSSDIATEESAFHGGKYDLLIQYITNDAIASPELIVEPAFIELGDIYVSDEVSTYITVRNSGNAVLEGDIQSKDVSIQIDTNHFSIHPQEEQQFQITIDTTALTDGNFNTSLFITSNGGDCEVEIQMTIVYHKEDLNQDGEIDQRDFRLFEKNFGTYLGEKEYWEKSDFNQDGVINMLDLFIMAKKMT
jgi:hypothetical protein